jgi:hypothetical protein
MGFHHQLVKSKTQPFGISLVSGRAFSLAKFIEYFPEAVWDYAGPLSLTEDSSKFSACLKIYRHETILSC